MGRLFGREKRAGLFSEPPVPPVYGGNMLGKVSAAVRPDEAMRVSAVWACVSLLANTVSMLPLETYKQNSEGVPNRIGDPGLVTSPAAGVSQSEWIQQAMVSLLLRGNAFGHVVARDSAERPTQVELWHPDAVQVRLNDEGRVEYRVGPNQVRMPAEDVWHVRGLTMPGAKVGLSPIAYAAEQIGLDISSRRFASDFFDSGGQPTGLLLSDQMITAEQAETIKQRFLTAATGRAPVAMGAGIKYQNIGVKPEESQFLLTQQANVGQIARFFGVPASMIGGSSGDSMTYANVEQRNLDFLTYGVSFWLKRLEDAISALLPRGQFVSFKTQNLLRVDAKTQAQVEIFQIAAKTRVPSEIRADHGWAPMTFEQKIEADMVPLGISPLGRPAAKPSMSDAMGDGPAVQLPEWARPKVAAPVGAPGAEEDGEDD